MASTNKTESLTLNQWIGADKPKMEDFNFDNIKIDTAIAQVHADLAGKVDQVSGKGLSTNDYTNTDKAKLTALPENVYAKQEVYDRQESRDTFTNAVRKTISGTTLNLADVQDGTRLAALSIDGKTVETGTGTRSPDNPFALTGVGESGEISIVISDGTNSRTVNIPAPIPLYSTPSAKDTINAIDGIIKRNTIKIVLDGVTNGGGTFSLTSGELTNTLRFSYNNPNILNTPNVISVVSDKLPSSILSVDIDSELVAMHPSASHNLLFRFLKPRGISNVATLNIWLQSNPIIIVAQETAPVTETVTPQEIPLYYPGANISSTDDTKPTLSATYNRDLNKVITELQAAIITLGGH